MKKLGENIWVHEDGMKLMGSHLGLRMTVVKLADGKLWVHSPTKLSPELAEEVKQLGTVGFIVGASNGHNLWLCDWRDAFPEAALYVSGGIPGKLKLTDFQLLDEEFDNVWEADLAFEHMPSVPFFNESVFLHKPTRSLIVTDLIQNHPDKKAPGAARLTQSFFRLLGFKGICVAPPLKMGFMIKDKAKFAAFIEGIKSWDFERIIVTHGEIIESNARQIFSDLCERFR